MRLGSKEYRQFVGIARGSAGEVCYHLLLARGSKYISDEPYQELRSGYDRVIQMLSRLSQSLGVESRSKIVANTSTFTVRPVYQSRIPRFTSRSRATLSHLYPLSFILSPSPTNTTHEHDHDPYPFPISHDHKGNTSTITIFPQFPTITKHEHVSPLYPLSFRLYPFPPAPHAPDPDPYPFRSPHKHGIYVFKAALARNPPNPTKAGFGFRLTAPSA